MKLLRTSNLIIFFLAILSSGICSADNVETKISITNAWVKAMPPSMKNTAAYMSITNHSKDKLTLISVESNVAETVELHTMSHENGKMIMFPIKEVSLDPESITSLKPGGIHIMLIDLKQPLQIEEEIEVILNFSDGTQTTVLTKVKHPMNMEHDTKEHVHEGHTHK